MIWTPERKALALASLTKWQGTPHRDRIAIVGVGIDCVQLMIEVMVDAGIIPRVKVTGYRIDEGMHSPSDRLKTIFKTCLAVDDMTESEPEFGDICIFKTGARSGHVGFYTDRELWHALANRCVTVSPYKLWRNEIDCKLRLREVGLQADPVAVSKI